ncbi:MAG: DUF4327 family protein [Leptolyngbyaceae bacterium]|nr:DUF4327 family protein [Leptolyngbyaceae bacterium]
MMVSTLQKRLYTVDLLRDEARELVQQGVIDRQQPIYKLCRYLPSREWECVELDLEENEYLLRDRICDLFGCEDWDND